LLLSQSDLFFFIVFWLLRLILRNEFAFLPSDDSRSIVFATLLLPIVVIRILVVILSLLIVWVSICIFIRVLVIFEATVTTRTTGCCLVFSWFIATTIIIIVVVRVIVVVVSPWLIEITIFIRLLDYFLVFFHTWGIVWFVNWLWIILIILFLSIVRSFLFLLILSIPFGFVSSRLVSFWRLMIYLFRHFKLISFWFSQSLFHFK
jgi:hypothetical protein